MKIGNSNAVLQLINNAFLIILAVLRLVIIFVTIMNAPLLLQVGGKVTASNETSLEENACVQKAPNPKR